MTSGQGCPIDWPRFGFPAFLLGLLLALQLPSLPPWSALLACLLAGLGLIQWSGVSRWFGVLLLAAIWLLANGQWRMADRLPATMDGRVVSAVVQIDTLPRWQGGQWQFDARVVHSGDADLQAGQRLAVRWYRRHPLVLTAGERWALRLRLDRGKGAREEHTWPISVFDLRARRAGRAQVVTDSPAWRLGKADGLLAWRESLSARVGIAVPGHAGAAVRALVIGDTRWLTNHDWALLRGTGLTHLFAISGFHVALVALAAVWLLRGLYTLLPGLGLRLPRGQAEALAALLGAGAYTAAVGFALPTVRTLWMVAALVVMRLYRRPLSLWPALVFAMTALLLVDPLAVLAPGFWLSSVGVAVLLWGLSNPSRQPWRDALRAQGWVSIGLLPVLAVFFAEWSVWGPAVNLVAIPLVSLLAVPLCLLGLGADLGGLPSVAVYLWEWAGEVLGVLWRGMAIVAAWPNAIRPMTLSSAALLLSVVGIIAVLLPGTWRRRLVGLVLCLPLMLGARDNGASDTVVRLLDIDDGQALLLSTSGEHWLLDAGRDTRQESNSVVAALRAARVLRLTGIVVTRDEPGRRGALAAVRDAYPEARVIQRAQCAAGVLHVSSALRITALHPPPLFPALGRESHCVLRVETSAAAILLPGDIGPLMQARLRREHAQHLRADLLVLPRLGQLDPAFMAEVQAATLLRSDRGRGNSDAASAPGRPHVWGTAQHGAIRLDWGGAGVPSISTAASQQWRWWQRY